MILSKHVAHKGSGICGNALSSGVKTSSLTRSAARSGHGLCFADAFKDKAVAVWIKRTLGLG